MSDELPEENFNQRQRHQPQLNEDLPPTPPSIPAAPGHNSTNRDALPPVPSVPGSVPLSNSASSGDLTVPDPTFESSGCSVRVSDFAGPSAPVSGQLLSDAAIPIVSDPANIAGPSSAHPADPETKEEEVFVDPVLFQEILELGFEESLIRLALFRTKGVGGAEGTVNWILEHSNESDFESDTEEDLTGMGAGHSLPFGLQPHKMVFVANTSLKMGQGKLAAQVGHATLGVYRLAQRTDHGQRMLEAWHTVGEMKVVVKGLSTEHLLDLFKQAKDMGLFAYVVADAGRTQIPAGSRTVLGIFGPSEVIDTVTGQLKLL